MDFYSYLLILYSLIFFLLEISSLNISFVYVKSVAVTQVTTFVTTEFQTYLYTEYVSVFMTYFSTKLHMPSNSDILVTAIHGKYNPKYLHIFPIFGF
jgi:hypothetical protein